MTESRGPKGGTAPRNRLSRREFARRLLGSVGVASALIAVSLIGGIFGYRYFEGMSWVDAFSNAAMILSGMGPLTPLRSTGGKLFAGAYALYSGLALIAATSIILTPVFHRVLHTVHLETRRGD